jgi:energy-converting hydrogenase A subunit R
MNKMKYVCFDLEGPLSPQDNAYDLMKLFPGGDKVFELISRYDDILTIEKKENYEPGDTLALIIPFLAYHNIDEKNVISFASKASLTGGAADLISYLNKEAWSVFCISTSYEPYAMTITRRLGISAVNTACTEFPIEQLANKFSDEDFKPIGELETKIVDINDIDDVWIKITLDEFYWHRLPQTKFGNVLNLVKPVGGQKKVNALLKFAEREAVSLSDFVAVGDSITDFKMLQTVNQKDGLAIAFNGNEYVLPYATIGLASLNIFDLKPVFDIWKDHGKIGVKEWIKQFKPDSKDSTRNNFKWLVGENNIEDYLQIHKKMRKLVREDAAKLG